MEVNESELRTAVERNFGVAPSLPGLCASPRHIKARQYGMASFMCLTSVADRTSPTLGRHPWKVQPYVGSTRCWGNHRLTRRLML